MIGEYNLTRVLASVLGADHVGGDVMTCDIIISIIIIIIITAFSV